MDVSIILVSYNTKDLTRDCIKSIQEKTEGLDYDIWVVDNASNDGSTDMIKNEFKDINLIESKENLGFGRANNLAIEKINSKYVFLLNTDTILLNNAIKTLFDYMELPENHKVGSCGGQLFNKDNTLQRSYGEFNHIDKLRRKAYINHYVIKHRLNKLFAKKVLNQTQFKHDIRTNNSEVDYIIGADLMLRKSVLDKVGTFDKRFFMYAEEAELQFRIRDNGYKVIFCPDAKIMHYGGASSYKANTSVEVEKMLMTGAILFFKICYGEKTAIEAKRLYIIYYLKYFILRLFSKKAFQRLQNAIEITV